MGPHFSRNRDLVSYSAKASSPTRIGRGNVVAYQLWKFSVRFYRSYWEQAQPGGFSALATEPSLHHNIGVEFLTGERNETICYEQETWVKRLTYLTR
jgi:hypothetical protein